MTFAFSPDRPLRFAWNIYAIPRVDGYVHLRVPLGTRAVYDEPLSGVPGHSYLLLVCGRGEATTTRNHFEQGDWAFKEQSVGAPNFSIDVVPQRTAHVGGI